MGFANLAIAIVAALRFLVVLLYKRVNLGVILNVTALFLALLALDWTTIPAVVYETSVDLSTVSVVLATFGIILLRQRYRSIESNCEDQAESSGLNKTLCLNLEQIIGVQKTFRRGRAFQSMS